MINVRLSHVVRSGGTEVVVSVPQLPPSRREGYWDRHYCQHETMIFEERGRDRWRS